MKMKKSAALILALIAIFAFGCAAGAAESENAVFEEKPQADSETVVTRGEFALLATTFLAENLGYTTEELKSVAERLSPQAPSFSDTDDEYVLLAARLGVIYGTGGSLFEPERGITREEAACMLARLYSKYSITMPKTELDFADGGEIAEWAKSDVEFCVASGVMTGASETEFDPKGAYTKKQAENAFEKLGELDGWRSENYRAEIKSKMTRDELIDEYFKSGIYDKDAVIETKYGTVVYMHTTGIPHSPSYFAALFDDTPEAYFFEAPAVGFGTTPPFEDFKLSEDGEKITFNVSYEERTVSVPDGDEITIPAGTYYFEIDLKKREYVLREFVP